jgi:hypothetical protein
MVGGFLYNCGGAKKSLYYEPSVDRQEVRFKRVAIVPNRLPLNLNDPEKWRKYNWEVATKFLRKRGIEVVEYETSLNVFNNSGLPLEDTKSSRDKYAELAEQLAVDVVVIPYYGTSATTKNFIIFTSMRWESVVTFQFFLKDRNEFISRLDATGSDNYVSGLLPLLGGLTTLVSPEAGAVAGLGAVLIDLSQTLFRSSSSHWRTAFRRAIEQGLSAFLDTYPRHAEAPPRLETKAIEEIIDPAVGSTLPNLRAALPELNKHSDEQILAAYRKKFPKLSPLSDAELIKLIEEKYSKKK